MTLFWLRPWSRVGNDPIRKGRGARRRASNWVPRLEALENRLLPSLTPQLLKEVDPAVLSSSPTQFTVVGNSVYFVAVATEGFGILSGIRGQGLGVRGKCRGW
jgi:hypothetical protein